VSGKRNVVREIFFVSNPARKTRPQTRPFVNPYLDEFNAIRDRLEALQDDDGASYAVRAMRYERYQNSFTGKTRADLVHKYAWAIPNEEAIATIAALSPIVELGAGTGYCTLTSRTDARQEQVLRNAWNGTGH
jgi:hypothetical protein